MSKTACEHLGGQHRAAIMSRNLEAGWIKYVGGKAVGICMVRDQNWWSHTARPLT